MITMETTVTINQYGVRAREYYREWRPQEYATMTDPERENFFREWGETAAVQMEELTQALAGEDPPGEGYLEKLGRLKMARLQAEEKVFAELPPPERLPEEEPDETETENPSGEDWIPLEEDPSHPFWQERAAEMEQAADPQNGPTGG